MRGPKLVCVEVLAAILSPPEYFQVAGFRFLHVSPASDLIIFWLGAAAVLRAGAGGGGGHPLQRLGRIGGCFLGGKGGSVPMFWDFLGFEGL